MLNAEEGGDGRKRAAGMSRCLRSWCVEIWEEGHLDGSGGQETPAHHPRSSMSWHTHKAMEHVETCRLIEMG